MIRSHEPFYPYKILIFFLNRSQYLEVIERIQSDTLDQVTLPAIKDLVNCPYWNPLFLYFMQAELLKLVRWQIYFVKDRLK